MPIDTNTIINNVYNGTGFTTRYDTNSVLNTVYNSGSSAISINMGRNFPPSFKDNMGVLGTALTGVNQYTMKQYRSTGVAIPHMAKGDQLSYNIQLNHDKKLGTEVHDFHIHMILPDTVLTGKTISMKYFWGIYKITDTIPATLPNSGITNYTTVAGDQYKHILFEVITGMTAPAAETYSSFLLISCLRQNTAADTHTGDVAVLGADCHYQTDRFGSVYDTYD